MTGAAQQPLPEWMQYVQALGPMVVAVVVGLFAGYIAWRQWETAKHRLRFDLYEKRFAVYSAIKELLNKVVLHGQMTINDIGDFHQNIRGAEFLFDADTRDFVMRLGTMALRASIRRSQLDRQPDHPRADQLIEEEEEILDFLRIQDQHLERLFGRYLDLSKIGIG